MVECCLQTQTAMGSGARHLHVKGILGIVRALYHKLQKAEKATANQNPSIKVAFTGGGARALWEETEKEEEEENHIFKKGTAVLDATLVHRGLLFAWMTYHNNKQKE